MSLKIATLFIAALVAQSSAFALKPLGDADPFTVPGFTITADKTADHDKLSLIAPEGVVHFTTAGFLNTTSWQFSSTNGVKTITQESLLTALIFSFEGTKATVGDVTVEGELLNLSCNSTYKIAFAASAADDDKCKLEGKIESSEILPYLIFLDFGENGAAFKAPAVLKEVTSTVAKALAGKLSEVLSKLFNINLPDILNVGEFCKALLDSSAEKFPEPDL